MQKSVNIYFGRAAYVVLFFVAMFGLYVYLECHKVPQPLSGGSSDVNSAQTGYGF
ncbi:MAG: hypothetical protein ABSG16_01825 [Candidatus Acidiferrum sp.]